MKRKRLSHPTKYMQLVGRFLPRQEQDKLDQTIIEAEANKLLAKRAKVTTEALENLSKKSKSAS